MLLLINKTELPKVQPSLSNSSPPKAIIEGHRRTARSKRPGNMYAHTTTNMIITYKTTNIIITYTTTHIIITHTFNNHAVCSQSCKSWGEMEDKMPPNSWAYTNHTHHYHYTNTILKTRSYKQNHLIIAHKHNHTNTITWSSMAILNQAHNWMRLFPRWLPHIHACKKCNTPKSCKMDKPNHSHHQACPSSFVACTWQW